MIKEKEKEKDVDLTLRQRMSTYQKIQMLINQILQYRTKIKIISSYYMLLDRLVRA
jgi:hypothetical protein